MQLGSRIRVTVGGRSRIGTVTGIYNEGVVGASFDARHPDVYWHLAYDPDEPVPGRIGPGNWKQNVDGGHVAYVID